jgi:poly(3-hydroxybutyrate) depolymerase
MEKNITDKFEIFYYISSKANTFTPAKTIFVCAPQKEASSYEAVEQFAKNSGWLDEAEEDGAVLVLPIARNGWQQESPSLIAEIYNETRQKFMSRQGDSIPGRAGFIWCWETLIYLVGYEEGAVFAGNVTVTHPNRFASVALVNGVPNDYTNQSKPSDHWLVRDISKDYSVKNREIPVCLWMLGKEEDFAKEALSYFSKSNQITHEAKIEEYDGINTNLYQNASEEAPQIRVSIGNFEAKPELAKTIMHQFFNNFIRWKNAPDGTLKPYLSKTDFYNSTRFRKDDVVVNDVKYDFFTYLPEGLETQDVADMPVVFSVHGRGEPSWIFATKNGWDILADETKDFILVLPDSPQNIWLFDRDGTVFSHIIDKLYNVYAIDKTRVYLTGFSNGGMITRQVANHFPELFAAISPWNAPFHDEFNEIISRGYDLPCFICAGDNDEKVAWEDVDCLLENMLKINHCETKEDQSDIPVTFTPDEIRDANNYYTKENKYIDGDRFQTFVYNSVAGHNRVSLTLMKNMPHGAVYDQSRAAWEFLKRFKRFEGSVKVSELKE